MLQNWITVFLMACVVLEASNAWVIREDSDSYAGDTYEAGRAFADDESLLGTEDLLLASNLPRIRTKKSASGSGRKKLCGTRLYHALGMACDVSRGKRSAPNFFSSLSRSAYPSVAMDYDSLDYASSIVNPLEALQQRKKLRGFQKRGGMRGVSDVCCARSCTMQELQNFCP